MKKALTDYTTVDFVTDDDFVDWVKSGKQGDVWLQLGNKNPEKVAIMDKAKEILWSLATVSVSENEIAKERVWNNIEAGIISITPKSRLFRYIPQLAAACLIGLLGVGTWIWYNNSTIVYSTTYGERSILTLPDSSKIILNANSSLSYKRNWRHGNTREIEVKGEAFLNIKHQGDTFKVAINTVNVTVLGTSFNVKDRAGVTRVSLERGSIRVDVKSQPGLSTVLRPGEEWTYDHKQQKGIKRQADLSATTAWTSGQLVFNATKVGDIIQMLQDNYGYRVILEDDVIKERRINGKMPLKSRKDIFFVLSNILNIEIIEQKDTLIFRSKDPN